MEITQMLLRPGVKGRPGIRIVPRGLVIHWTANLGKGADAKANRNYFNSGVAASAHYIVDDHEIIQCIPENEMAYHVGAQRYKPEAVKALGTYPNRTTIGIEWCVDEGNDFWKTYHNVGVLAAEILKRHGLGANNLWRHYDITGKDCPKFFIDDAMAKKYTGKTAAVAWQEFKANVERVMREGVRL